MEYISNTAVIYFITDLVRLL